MCAPLFTSVCIFPHGACQAAPELERIAVQMHAAWGGYLGTALAGESLRHEQNAEVGVARLW